MIIISSKKKLRIFFSLSKMFSQNVGKEYLILQNFSAYQKTFHFYLKLLKKCPLT